ncbi:MAG: bactofilin family protein [Flavisolibacter sp.]
MFKEKNHTSGDKGISNSATLIAPGTILKGDVQSENDLRIGGTIQGNVKCTARVIVGPSGFVEGNIEGANADVIGKVKGNVHVKELLQLREKGNVEGNVIANKLQIDPTAVFNGKCQMGASAASVVLMGKTDVQQTAEAK